MKDKITSLDEYRVFITELGEAMQKRNGRTIAVIYGDIKHFSYFNDKYGFERGDALLTRLASFAVDDKESFIGASRVISDNIVAAYCLDDFSENELEEYIFETATGIERQLREEFDCSRIRLAIGVFLIKDGVGDVDAETAVANANLARKISKEPGNFSVIFYTPEMSEKINRELEIVSSIDRAIADHEFVAYYQPKIDSKTNRIVGAEALVRWQKKDGTFIYPDQFIPAIEKSKQIIDVDYYMYREVFTMLANRIKAGKTVLPISLNVSRQHMENLEIIDYVRKLLRKYEIPPELLEFELTETALMENGQNVETFIDEFHKMGVKVSMDDFGSGYSSLNLLSAIPLDVIKLDRCFLHSKNPGEKERVIITNIINMIKQLRMVSLCEGVETDSQSEFLKEIGCDIQQGFFFSRPVPPGTFEEILDGNPVLGAY